MLLEISVDVGDFFSLGLQFIVILGIIYGIAELINHYGKKRDDKKKNDEKQGE